MFHRQALPMTSIWFPLLLTWNANPIFCQRSFVTWQQGRWAGSPLTNVLINSFLILHRFQFDKFSFQLEYNAEPIMKIWQCTGPSLIITVSSQGIIVNLSRKFGNLVDIIYLLLFLVHSQTPAASRIQSREGSGLCHVYSNLVQLLFLGADTSDFSM